MLLDEKMDHGPIINQAAVVTEEKWPVKGPELDDILANSGAYLLTETVPKWLAGTLTPNEQNHDAATYTSLFRKGENEIILDPNNLPTGEAALEALRKIYAWQGIGDTFFVYKDKRVKIKDATLSESGALDLQIVIPENKQAMSFFFVLAVSSFLKYFLSIFYQLDATSTAAYLWFGAAFYQLRLALHQWLSQSYSQLLLRAVMIRQQSHWLQLETLYRSGDH